MLLVMEILTAAVLTIHIATSLVQNLTTWSCGQDLTFTNLEIHCGACQDFPDDHGLSMMMVGHGHQEKVLTLTKEGFRHLQ